MFKPRPCGCKGIRTCLVCESEFLINTTGEERNFALRELNLDDCFEYCHLCNSKAWKGTNVWKDHPNHVGQSVDYPGVLLVPDFLTAEEEQELVLGCDSIEWDLSQSGRRKQNFGPKTNFKKMKINGKSFAGFPKFSEYAQKKLSTVPLLKDFQTIEQCAIEYRPETGACIDPHIDDCWVWGERVISLSLISDSVLTMTKYVGGIDKYNLRYHYDHNPDNNPFNNADDSNSNNTCSKINNSDNYPIVRLPMPARSLLVLYGAARYEWEHSILRRDIVDRRICMAYREFTHEYLQDGQSYVDTGRDICEKAQNFNSTNENDTEIIL